MFQSIYKLFQYIITTYVKEVKYFSLYSNQFNRERESERINYPSVFLEILPAETKQYLNSVQYSIMNVRLHIVSEFNTSFNSTDKMLDTSFEHLALLDKIHIMFNNVSFLSIPKEFYDNDNYNIGKIVRNGIEVSRDFGSKKDSIVSFQFYLTDLSAEDEYTYVQFTEESDITTNITFE